MKPKGYPVVIAAHDEFGPAEVVWFDDGEVMPHRIRAHLSGRYAGCDAPVIGPEREVLYSGANRWGDRFNVMVTRPDWVEQTVYELADDGARRAVRARVYFDEWFGYTKGAPVPNVRWARRPHRCLEERVEIAALSLAFSDEPPSPPAALARGAQAHRR